MSDKPIIKQWSLSLRGTIQCLQGVCFGWNKFKDGTMVCLTHCKIHGDELESREGNFKLGEKSPNPWGTKMKRKALVVLSGGQDSTTCLYWALQQGWEVHTITFDYGQKHKVEISSAMFIAGMAGVEPYNAEVVYLPEGVLKGSSPLVNKAEELEQYADHQSLPGGLEKTFVPMRNQLFLTIAANRAYVIGADILVTGVCQEDSGGYPDCRATFIQTLQNAINYGTFTGEPGTMGPLQILTPLMHMTKAESVKFAQTLPGCMEALAYSHTSYDGAYPPVGHDHATLLRAKGFEQAGVPDPLVVRAYKEGLMPLPMTTNYDSVRQDESNIGREDEK